MVWNRAKIAAAMLSAVLATSLSACNRPADGRADGAGKSPETSQPADGVKDTRGTIGDVDKGQEEASPYGSFSFDNADGAYLTLEGDLAQYVLEDDVAAIFDAIGGNLEAVFANVKGDNSTAMIFRFDDSLRWDDEFILEGIGSVAGNGTHTTIPVPGSVVVAAYAVNNDGVSVVAIEPIEAGGAWVLVTYAVDHDTLMAGPCARVALIGTGTVLADYFAGWSEETQKVGGPISGYIEIPSSWYVLKNADPVATPEEGFIQYTDGYGTSVTLYGYPVGDGDEDAPTALAWYLATSLFISLEDNPSCTYSDYETEEIAGRPAVVLISQWDGGAHGFTFFIEGDDYVYYVSCEGYPDAASDLAYRV